MARLGVVTGLPRELNCLKGFPAARWSRVACAGPGFERASSAARSLLAEGCGGLLSFGIAGGLDPALDSGAVVVVRAVIDADGQRLSSDGPWRERLIVGLAGIPGVLIADLAGSAELVFTPARKQALWGRTGAAAVDMESHAVARVAAEFGVPFLAIRAVADPWSRRIPEWVPASLRPDGRPRPGALAIGTLAHPRDAPALLRLALDARTAFRSLRRVAVRASPLFHFDAESLH